MNTAEAGVIKPHIHITPKKGWQLIDVKELYHYRALFYFLVARNIQVKYRQMVLGAFWEHHSALCVHGDLYALF